MDYAYAAADLVVSRSGACTVSELCLVAKPDALRAVAQRGRRSPDQECAGAGRPRGLPLLVPDAEAPARAMDDGGELLADPARRSRLSRNIEALAVPDAAERIVDEIEKVMKWPHGREAAGRRRHLSSRDGLRLLGGRRYENQELSRWSFKTYIFSESAASA